MRLEDGRYYWVKCNANDDWQIGEYNQSWGIFKLKKGGQIDCDRCAEIDRKPIERNN